MACVSNERDCFSRRLRQSLDEAQYSPDSPTELARNFNLRYPGRPITVHAARKWLLGEAIPTQDKMRTLATWLGVSVHWLRFGIAGEKVLSRAAPDVLPGDLALMADLRLLDEHQRLIVREFIHVILKANRFTQA